MFQNWRAGATNSTGTSDPSGFSCAGRTTLLPTSAVFASFEFISRVAVNDPSDARIKNIRKTRNSPRYHPPRPWRSEEETHIVRRSAWQWFTSRIFIQYNGHAKPVGVAPSNRQNP